VALMESLYLLIPLSVLLILAVGGLLAWSVMTGQFDALDDEGDRILRDDPAPPAAQDKASTAPSRSSSE
jgi:cbb3-type cytochrome oxidase maturation protein